MSPASPERLLLAGDVGGTKTNLGLFAPAAAADEDGTRPRLLRSAAYPSPEYPGLAPILAAFLGEDAAAVGAAGFGVAGPVAGDRCARLPNLDWPELDAVALASEIGLPPGRVRLINDLVATAEAIPFCGLEDLAVLQAGKPEAEGNRALVAAGTGLGMAFLPRIGETWVPVASEGGHMDFAPQGDEQIGLAVALGARYGHVSIERVVSGMGLPDIYEYVRAAAQDAQEVPAVAERLRAAADPAPLITAAALSGESALCSRALDLFVAAYGAVAGNLALAGTATGGVFLGGGIAPKILPRLREGGFLRAFTAKGRFQAYLEAIPVRVLLDDHAALLGAASVAARLLPSR